MSSPTRWRDDASAPDDLRHMMRGAHRSRPMPREVRARSARRIHRLMVVPAAAGVFFWMKGLAIAGLCAAGVVAVARLVPVRTDANDHAGDVPLAAVPSFSATSHPPQWSPHDRVVPPAPETPPSELAVRPPTVPSSVRPVAEAKRPFAAASENVPPDPGSTDSLAREAEILERARELLGSHPDQALDALSRHRADFPDGRLNMERDLLALDALLRLGRFGEARTHGQALLARARGSIYEGRVRAMLDALPASP